MQRMTGGINESKFELSCNVKLLDVLNVVLIHF